MISDPLFYLAAISAILIVGISKGGFGGGLGVMAVPIMSLVISPVQAASIMLPILCLMDIFSLWHFRGKGDWKILKTILPAALLGIALGTFTFKYFNEDQIRVLVGLIALSFTLHHWLAPKYQSQPRASYLRGGFWGILSGFTSFGVHAGGPPANAYLLPLGMQKSVFAGTTIIFFACINYAKLIPYYSLDQLDAENLLTSLSLAIFAPIGVRLGFHLHQRISGEQVFKFCYLFLFLTGAKLFYDGITNLY
ncbi:MAG: sulfite exporter TauE/SafE family protein [Pseudomonadales bacterium]